jgi:TAT (twin-arginine translocation) pathway-exported protein
MASKDDNAEGSGVSRRNFLKSTGVASIAATVVGGREARCRFG